MRSLKKVCTRLLLAVLTLAIGVMTPLASVGCGGKSDPVAMTAEVNEPFDLYALVDGETDYGAFTVTKDGEAVEVGGQYLTFTELGVYNITHTDGGAWDVTVSDTTAPVVQIVGSFLTYQAEDRVELPEVHVVDNYDGDIEDYDISVWYGEDEVTITEGTFPVDNAGQYVIRVSAVDSSGNPGSAEKTFAVSPRTERAVPAGTVVTLLPDYAYYLLPEGADPADYDYSYAVYANGESEPSVLTDTFTVEANSYYEAYITAASKADASESYTAYVSYVEEHAKLLTFTGLLDGDVTSGPTELICNPYGVAERSIYKAEDGSTSMLVTVEDASDPVFRAPDSVSGLPVFVDSTYEMPFVLLAWTLNIWDLPNVNEGGEHPDMSRISYSYDVRVEGTLKADSAVFRFDYGTLTETATLTAEGEAGESFTLRGHVESDNSILYWLDDNWGYGWYQRVLFDDAAVEDFRVYIDNVRLTWHVPPTLTAEEEAIMLPAGSSVPLTSEGLGVTAQDVFGAAVREISVSKILAGGVDVTADYEGETSIPAPQQPEIYTITLQATDYYGNVGEKTITVQVGDADFTAPELTCEEDNYVSAGTQITLGETGIADYLTVTDDSAYTLSYSVRANGVSLGELQSFTVSAGDYYEVSVTATDAEDNTSRAFLLFADQNLSGKLFTMSEAFSATQISAAEIRIDHNGARAALLWPASAEGINQSAISADAFGNRSVRVRPAPDNQDYIEVYLACADGATGLTGSFEVRVEGETDLSGGTVLFTAGGKAYTVADIGTTMVVGASGLVDREDEVTNGIRLSDIEHLKTEEGLWLYFDNFQIDTRSAPSFAGRNSVLWEPADPLTFSAEALSITAADAYGAVLSPAVTEVRFNGVANPEYTDGYTLQTPPEGPYEIDFTVTDRWGISATFTVTVSVASQDELPPSMTFVSDNIVPAGTQISGTQTGIAGYLTVEDDSAYTLTYRVVRNGAEEVESAADSFSFSPANGVYYEVYVTAADEHGNTSYAYLLFADNSIADTLRTFNTTADANYQVFINISYETAVQRNGENVFQAYPFDGYTNSQLVPLTEDAFGNEYLRIRPTSTASTGELYFFIPAGGSNMTGTFTLRLEGTSDLAADTVLFTLNGRDYTVADIGKTFSVTVTGLNDRGAGNGTSTPIQVTNLANLIAETDVWLCFDNLSLRAA